MELSLKFFCVVFGCLTTCSFVCPSSRGLEEQHCGNLKFYCPTDKLCEDRTLRCTPAKVCLEIDGNEAKCNPAGKNGGVDRYHFYKKKSNLRFFSSRRKKRQLEDLKHWFVEYRGFVYEFGKAGYQELDVNDPKYKYGPGRVKVVDEKKIGSSSCTRDQVIRFVEKWLDGNPNYDVLSNNCQDFAKALLAELGNNCPDENEE